MSEGSNDGKIVDHLVSDRIAFQYAFAMLLVALAEKKLIDPARVFQLHGVLIDGFGNGSVNPPDVSQLVAEKLKGIETTFFNLVTIPEGAGRS